MEIRVPHQIIFKVEQPVAVSDFVTSLLATEQLLRDTAPVLEALFPGFTIEKIDVSVSEVSEGSLRELLYVALFGAFQKDLERAVPSAIEQLTGIHVSSGNESIVTLVFCLILFYAAETLYKQVSKEQFSKHIRRQLNDVTAAVSRETGLSEEKIASILEEKFGKSRLRLLMHQAANFFAVSKRGNNAPILIQNRTVTHDEVAEVPSDAQIEESEVPEIVRQFENINLEIHAMDMDRAKTGWAAIIPKVSPKRLRMELYPPIKPSDLYTRSKIRGDVAVVFQKKKDGSYQPATIHLMAIKS